MGSSRQPMQDLFKDEAEAGAIVEEFEEENDLSSLDEGSSDEIEQQKNSKKNKSTHVQIDNDLPSPEQERTKTSMTNHKNKTNESSKGNQQKDYG